MTSAIILTLWLCSIHVNPSKQGLTLKNSVHCMITIAVYNLRNKNAKYLLKFNQYTAYLQVQIITILVAHNMYNSTPGYYQSQNAVNVGS